ncbi:MAG TPA: lipopolysaccharide biosynthesis protein [Niabella sp.]|nr:lipopolysaccharide biosynthesis protein [Niabella sp.]HOZ97349.1 lipopolysaccharide biosynthesis protein [Niabella sp.]HQW15380.1 lipopolysaccharide biosynthesis protein [Niabella sp.]HQX20574.1 lipopolysaccharide biosynthesis protein [Niabella sp.]HQX40959.1 lipopolysaccharide biosynthesis protein [Niabella sp.]
MTDTIKANPSPIKKKSASLPEIILALRDWLRYLLKNWYWILVFGLAGAAIGFWYAKSQKPVYSATTTFVLETGDKGGGFSQYAGIASMMGIDLGGGGGGIFQGENILELYKSRTMISKTLLSEVTIQDKKQMLLDRYIQWNNLRAGWQKPALKDIRFNAANTYANPWQQLIHDSILSQIVKDISQNSLLVSKPDKKLNIIHVTVKSGDELFAKAFNELLVQNVNEFYFLTKTKKSLNNIAILQQKTDSVRALMTSSIARVAQTVDATPNLNPTRQTQRIVPLQNSQANAKINETILSQLIQNLELSKMALQKETPLIQVVDQPILPLDIDPRLGKLLGLIIGGLAGGVLIVLVLIGNRYFRIILGN